MNWLRDWLRGYSDKDVVSACRKILDPHTSIFTDREYLAYCEEGITREYAQRILKSAETIERIKSC